MENLFLNNNPNTNVMHMISNSYNDLHPRLLNFIAARIGNRLDAEDILQDTFLRLLDHAQMLRPETITSYIYTIARNLVIDYLRRHYKKQEMSANLIEFTRDYCVYSESALVANDLQAYEMKKLQTFSPLRKKVYELSRFDNKSVDEITLELEINKKQVENFLFVGRKAMREYFKECI